MFLWFFFMCFLNFHCRSSTSLHSQSQALDQRRYKAMSLCRHLCFLYLMESHGCHGRPWMDLPWRRLFSKWRVQWLGTLLKAVGLHVAEVGRLAFPWLHLKPSSTNQAIIIHYLLLAMVNWYPNGSWCNTHWKTQRTPFPKILDKNLSLICVTSLWKSLRIPLIPHVMHCNDGF